jgi:hypothetical protein
LEHLESFERSRESARSLDNLAEINENANKKVKLTCPMAFTTLSPAAPNRAAFSGVGTFLVESFS